MARTKAAARPGQSLSRRIQDNWQMYLLLLADLYLQIHPYVRHSGHLPGLQSQPGLHGQRMGGLYWFRRFFSSSTCVRMIKNTVLISLYSLITICSIVLLLVAYPLYYVVVASFSDPYEVYAGKTFLLPSGFTMDGYKGVFLNNGIVPGRGPRRPESLQGQRYVCQILRQRPRKHPAYDNRL